MTVMQMRSGPHLWQHTWDISMLPVRFYSVTGSGKKVIIVLGCILNPTGNGDYWKMNGYCNSIICGDCGRTISTAGMPVQRFKEVRQAVADAGEFIERLERLVNGVCS